jgi:hypothetical protein
MKRVGDKISAREWNDLSAGARNQIKGGPGCGVLQTSAGRTISARRPLGWDYPWKLLPVWNPNIINGGKSTQGAWCVAVKPGFVNGRDPVITMFRNDTVNSSDDGNGSNKDDSWAFDPTSSSGGGGNSNVVTVYSLYDTEKRVWIGDGNGAFTFNDYESARIAAVIYNSKMGWNATRVVPRQYGTQSSNSNGGATSTNRFFASDSSNGGNSESSSDPAQASQKDSVDIHLTDERQPYLVVRSFREPTAATTTITDAMSANGISSTAGAYPSFFIHEGAQRPHPAEDLAAVFGGTSLDSFTQNLADQNAGYGTRRIVAADIILIADHIGVKTDTMVTVPEAPTGTIVVVSPAFTSSLQRFPYRLSAVSKITPPQYPTMLDRLNGDLTEPTEDQLLIGTLWLLSPPDADDEAPVDETWVPYVQGKTFWNLGYGARNFASGLIVNQAITFPEMSILAGGVASGIVGAELARVNDANNAVVNALNAISLQGYFWTI